MSYFFAKQLQETLFPTQQFYLSDLLKYQTYFKPFNIHDRSELRKEQNLVSVSKTFDGQADG